ncbi:MAG: glycosyltransferase family 1 protein [Dehalococcoidia bacterium]
MILVKTRGDASMDLYATALAEQLNGVRELSTDVYARSARRFNVPLISPDAVRALRADMRFMRDLRSVQEPVHFPNHHLARYGHVLRVPYVVTVHDLIRYFDLHRRVPLIDRPNLRDRLYLALDYAGIRRAAAIIAVSATTKADLVEHLGVPESRVHVVYEGVDHTRFRPVDARPFDFPYLLYVGSEQPRKNLGILLEAFAALKRTGLHPDLRLVKVGLPGGRDAAFRAETERLAEQHGVMESTIFADRIHAEALPAYYAGAACTVLPSLYEGFGFPVLEAMACGSPVVVSSGGSLPEIAGDAAVVVSPRDPAALADALSGLLTDSRRVESLRVLGVRRAAEFSWTRAARETQRVYDIVSREALGATPVETIGAGVPEARPAPRSTQGHPPARPGLAPGGLRISLRPGAAGMSLASPALQRPQSARHADRIQ